MGMRLLMEVIVMKTKKQDELVNSFLFQLDPVFEAPLYHELALYLSECGYNPKKQRSYIVFKHDLHGREMAKMGPAWTKDHTPYFALRFSACKGYSQRFAEIVRAYIEKNPNKLFPHCEDGNCIFCGEDDRPPAYSYVFPGGESKFLCGAKCLVIPGLAPEDMAEFKELIREEHIYLMKREVSVTVE